jgi:glycosyltransferase involved in cell wall biosynthesis
MAGISRGGGEIWDLKIAEELQKIGVDVTFYVGKPLRSELLEPIEQFEYVEIPTPYLRDFAYAAPIGIGGALSDIDTQLFTNRVIKQLQKRDHDLIHINSNPQFGRVVSQFDVPITIKMNGPPHSLWYDHIHPFTSSYGFFRYFDSVIAHSETASKIRKRTNCEVTEINPGVDTSAFTVDGPKIKSNGLTVLFVGRFVPAKNIPLLLEAFAEVLKKVPDSKLILVGDGPLKEKIVSKVDSLGISESVQMPGYIKNDQLPQFYRTADVFALTSRHESFGMVLLEAMSCGTPVVASQVGAVPELISDNKTGLSYPEGNKEALICCLERVLQDEELRTRLGKNARIVTQKEYDWQNRAEKLYHVYKQVLEKSSNEVN